ncbi:MAG: hypothetical protein ACK4RN_06355 [Pseudorhodobacter sp.]
MHFSQYFKGFRWCPETDLNRRHTDFQSKEIPHNVSAVGSKKYQDKARTPGERDTPASEVKSAYILSKYMKPDHKRMSRMLGYALTLGSPEAWQGFRRVAQVRMTEAERAMMAFFMLNTISRDHAESISGFALAAAGSPLPPFLGGMEDARTWANRATREELKAYALASFEAMTPQDQAAFFQHISTIEVAA